MLKRFRHILMLAILLTGTLQVLAQNALPDKVCVGTERHYRVTGNVNSIFTWTINGQIQSSVNNVLQMTWPTSGTYTLEVQEYLNNCSGAIKSGVVTVVDIPTIVSKGDLLVWAQNPIQTLDANASIVPETGINVVWYDVASGGTVIVSPTLNQVGTKTYYAEANNGFCSSPSRTPVTLTIKTNKGPVAVDDVFATSDLTLEGNMATNDIASEGGQLIYKTTPITAPLMGVVVINTDGTFTYTRKTTGSGTDEFVYQVCDNGSPVQCSQARVIINFNNRMPVARILGAPSLILGNCNTTGQLLDASTSTGNGLAYSWLPSIYLDNASSSKPKFHVGITTRYHLTVTDSGGQKDTTSILVVVADAPKAVTDKNVFVDTPNANILLNGAKSTGTGLTYLWLSKEGIILNGETQPTAQVSGLGMYYLQVSDSWGCISRDSVNVGIYIQAINDTAKTKVNERVVINVLRNDLPQHAINPSSISIVTAPMHGTATTTADSLVVYQPEEFYAGQDEFIYSICDYFGNCDNARVLVFINGVPFFIPEAFSPNGDGINDKFEIKGLGNYKTVEIEIFNRWGNVVYHSKNYGQGNGKAGFWDGTASSTMSVGSGPVPSGTYYYVMKMNGHENISGAVYLDR